MEVSFDLSSAPGRAPRASRHPSILRRLLPQVPLVTFALVALSTRALAGPADADEPLIHPRRELDPRLDLAEPSRSWRIPSPRRAPVWVAIDASLQQRTASEPSFGAMLLLGIPLDRLHARALPAPA